MNVPILSINQLTVSRDDRCLFRDLSFVVGAGQLIQIEGPNGAGKSSLIRAIAGLLDTGAGSIAIQGQHDADARRDQVLLWTALPGVKMRLDARTNLAWLLNQRNESADPDGLLAKVGLAGWEDVPLGQMSTGQVRRVGMAALLASKKPLWLLDEPYNALDIDAQTQLSSVIQGRLDQGGSVVLASHHAAPGLSADQQLRLGQP
ncbi:heme ABC exporter ATP-binding protein CcmA [Litorivicinus lipolyticus]|uniref:Heme ABC exporter ATP-binding protein CcmA n=1 Tax=Litorivicinus lipolyticus TaxID=418701 RepID=A0A5Q2QAI6_9GAMM|nr:heme ABC exporter ATP-binding protein CcmA [Litorivicinus lipolyticus]QGG80034.1 heme ABC exporter ATP-binding protein CcmA [Litorivicinus lipolyticus]